MFAFAKKTQRRRHRGPLKKLLLFLFEGRGYVIFPSQKSWGIFSGLLVVQSVLFYTSMHKNDISRRLLSNGSLYFSTVYHTRNKRPDEGLYQCVATVESIGTIVSRTATLKVAGTLEDVCVCAKKGEIAFCSQSFVHVCVMEMGGK